MTRAPSNTRAYALLDVILAVTVFAIWGTGMVVFLQKITDTSNSYSRDRLIQYGLESILTEARHRPVEEMNTEYFDPDLEVTYRTVSEPLEMADIDGNALADLYRVTATATFQDDGGEQIETAEIYVYQPQEDERK